MLTLAGVSAGRYCDGVARRDFLQIGALALGGVAMPQILEAEARAGIRSSHKAIIMVFLAGGPPPPGYGRSEESRPVGNSGRVPANLY